MSWKYQEVDARNDFPLYSSASFVGGIRIYLEQETVVYRYGIVGLSRLSLRNCGVSRARIFNVLDSDDLKMIKLVPYRNEQIQQLVSDRWHWQNVSGRLLKCFCKVRTLQSSVAVPARTALRRLWFRQYMQILFESNSALARRRCVPCQRRIFLAQGKKSVIFRTFYWDCNGRTNFWLIFRNRQILCQEISSQKMKFWVPQF